MNQQLFSYIAACPTAYQAVSHTAGMLEEAGFTPLREADDWHVVPGRSYYVTRNASSLIAFRIPKSGLGPFRMAAAHGDSPSFKIKENAENPSGAYVRLDTEKYGGMLCASWMDRPLSVAGRAVVRTEAGIETRLVDLKEPCALIPNVAIHMNRKANEGYAYDLAVDMLPLWQGGGFRRRIADAAGVTEEALLSTDLFLYNPQPGAAWGDYISAPRLDDLQCAFAALTGFLAAAPQAGVPVFCLFDNEEVGSETKQGAASTFLWDVLARLAGRELPRLLASSFLVSCDNAHAIHPNHPELADKNHAPVLNGGVVVKYNASQRYTTDAVSAAVFGLCCEKAGVSVQRYANRANLAGGSTLGSIANTQVSVNTVDVGLPQLAMHSAFETAGARDTEALSRALAVFYRGSLEALGNGAYRLVLPEEGQRI